MLLSSFPLGFLLSIGKMFNAQKTLFVGFSIHVLFAGLDGDRFRRPTRVQIALLCCLPGPSFLASKEVGWNCDWAKPDINEDRDSKIKKKMI